MNTETVPTGLSGKNEIDPEIQEGKVTRFIEQSTAKVPSVGYLSLAVGSMVLSAVVGIAFKKASLGNFIGLWAPCFLLLGNYNKIVKVESEIARSLLH